LKCAGCGSRGTLQEQVIQAPSGAYVRMLVCGSCRNQSLMG
jgi:formate dehydrogenase maturation protein FdhE